MATTQNYTLKAQLARSILLADLTKWQGELEQARIDEGKLRTDLVLVLRSLSYDVNRAAFKIETRQWEDGYTGLIIDRREEGFTGGIIDRVNEAEIALTDCIDDIKHLEYRIEDAQNELNDEALWLSGGNEAA